MSIVTKYAVGSNSPGYLPDDSAEVLDSWSDAKKAMTSDMESFADYLEEGGDDTAKAHVGAIIRDEIEPTSEPQDLTFFLGEGPDHRAFFIQEIQFTRVYFLAWRNKHDGDFAYDFWFTVQELQERFPVMVAEPDGVSVNEFLVGSYDFEGNAEAVDPLTDLQRDVKEYLEERF